MIIQYILIGLLASLAVLFLVIKLKNNLTKKDCSGCSHAKNEGLNT